MVDDIPYIYDMTTLEYVILGVYGWICIPYDCIHFILKEKGSIVINTFMLLTSWIFAIPIGMLIGYIVWKTNRN